MLQDLEATWSNIAQVSPQLKDIILNTRFIQVAFQSDAVIILVFEIKLADTTGTVTICIPYTVLEPILPKLSVQSWFVSSRKNRPVDSALVLRNEVQKVSVPVSVILGSTDVSVEELLAIQPGDVIRLDAQVGRELQVLIAGHTKYLAQPGRVGNKLAARITQVVTESEVSEVGEQSGEKAQGG